MLPGGRALIFDRMEGVDAERSAIVALDLASESRRRCSSMPWTHATLRLATSF